MLNCLLVVSNVPTDALLAVAAEWLEETEIPSLVPRESPLVDPKKLKRILAIVGPRRAGKTYLMYQLVASLLASGRCTKADILFVDFEDYRLASFAEADVDRLLAAFHQLTGHAPRFLFFDEIQQLPSWSRVLRTLHNRRRFKIIVSGSNSKLLSREVATELRGRYDDVLLLPFSFREYLRSQEISYTRASLRTAARGRLVAAFDEYLRRGGFPEAVLAATDAARRKILQNYYRTIFYRDLIERYNIKARYVLDAMMAEFLETYAAIFSISRFEKTLKSHGLAGSKRTIANYLHYLQEAFFIFADERFSFSPRRRTMNPKKVYLMDTGFAALGRPFTENRGRVLENAVAIELKRRDIEFYHYKNTRECDFIIKQGARPALALQVCWELTPENEARELAGLASACQTLDIPAGRILTYDQSGVREIDGRRIDVAPVWRWMLEDEPL